MSNLTIVLILSFLIGGTGVFYSFSPNFYTQPEYINTLYAMLDIIFSILVVYIVVNKNKNRVANFQSDVEFRFALFLTKYKIVVYALAFYTAWLAYQSVVHIMNGAVRQTLMMELGAAGIDYLVVSSFFKVIFGFTLLFKIDMKLKLVIILGFFLTMVITGSRNELTYAGYLLLTLSIFLSSKRIYIQLFFVLCVFLFFAILITVFAQDRPITEGVYGVLEIIDKHFLYKAYSVHLASYAIDVSSSFEKIFYPFFGYSSEWILTKLFVLDDPIDSDFVKKYYFIGYDSHFNREYFANVVFPWWSWFVGVFGTLGLVIKALYSFIILDILIKRRYYVTFIFILSYVLFTATGGTLLITLNSTITIALCILIDFFSKRNIREVYER